ncbi:MAG TPA: NAD(P)H-quinone oxidoreductase [Steroidobacteraceae bacterium]
MAESRTMRVVDVAQPGGPEQLVLTERPLPSSGPHDVLIKVAAAGLNRADILQRRGAYPSPPGAPTNPGLEASGTVEAVGAQVREFKIGDTVCALLQGGGYSEYCAVHEGQVLPIPRGISLVHAAALPEAFFTVWSNVFEFGRLHPGETLLVHGGTSGIGVTAIQLGTALGHTVFATAGSDEKCRACESLGAKLAINYKTQDFVEEVTKATDGRGVNVILDMVGGKYLSRNLQALAVEGRLVMIASQGGTKGELDVLRVMQRRLTVTGSTLRAREVEFKQSIKKKLLDNVWPLLESGRIKPVIDSVYAMKDVAQAHARMESSEHIGKILLEWR